MTGVQTCALPIWSETEGTYFYQERLTQLISDKAKRAEFSSRFAEIFNEENIHQRPSPYYILLAADGDNMGLTIDAQDSLEKHRQFSQKLSEFAQEAMHIIESSAGAPIYVGGDDVLAYLPLHTALQCVSELNSAFDEKMQGISSPEGKNPTLSAGLVIAHHLTPLSDVLETARRAEKQAKGIPGKNALVIVSSKRGGADRAASAKLSDLIERMQTLINYAQQKPISGGTAYELQTLHQQLSDTRLPLDAFQREALRIIRRKREAGGGQEIPADTQQKFAEWFKDSDLSLAELAQEMIIAGEFAGAYEMAHSPSGGKEKQP